jgi:hypothetical protein
MRNGDYMPVTDAELQGDDVSPRPRTVVRNEKHLAIQGTHVASPDCWCHPSEDEPGVFVHQHNGDGARQ